jgi:hypothetical protein
MSDDWSRVWKKTVATELGGPAGGPGRGEESRGNPATWPLYGFSEVFPGFAADVVHALSTTFLFNRTFYGYLNVWQIV